MLGRIISYVVFSTDGFGIGFYFGGFSAKDNNILNQIVVHGAAESVGFGRMHGNIASGFDFGYFAFAFGRILSAGIIADEAVGFDVHIILGCNGIADGDDLLAF